MAVIAACGQPTPAPSPTPDAAEAFTIPTSDGGVLAAHLFGSERTRLVIFLHQFAGDQSDWFDLAEQLAAGGRTAALTFDFRGYGESTGEREGEEALVDDVRAAVSFARERGFESVVLVGASMGATAAIVAAVETPVEGVIGISAPASFAGIDATEAIRRLSVPVLLTAGREDISAMDSLDLMADDATEVVVFDDDAHGAALVTSGEDGAPREWLLGAIDEMFAAVERSARTAPGSALGVYGSPRPRVGSSSSDGFA